MHGPIRIRLIQFLSKFQVKQGNKRKALEKNSAFEQIRKTTLPETGTKILSSSSALKMSRYRDVISWFKILLRWFIFLESSISL